MRKLIGQIAIIQEFTEEDNEYFNALPNEKRTEFIEEMREGLEELIADETEDHAVISVNVYVKEDE